MCEGFRRRVCRWPQPDTRMSAVGGGVADGDGAAREDGEFFGRVYSSNKRSSFRSIPLRPSVGADIRLGFEAGWAELGIGVGVPIEHVEEVIEVVVVLRGDVLDEEVPRHRAAFHHRLIHREHVGVHLRLIGHQRPRRVRMPGSICQPCPVAAGTPSSDRGCRCRPRSSVPGAAISSPWCRAPGP